MARDAIVLPDGCMRVLIFSNGVGCVPAGLVRAGDVCVHLNAARHASEVMEVPGTWQALIVRHASGRFHVPGVPRPGWFIPESFEGFCHVHFTPCVHGWSESAWWQDYALRNPGKCPTTGFLAYREAREVCRVRGIPVVLVGFDPGGDVGTEKWGGHAWGYEAEVLRRERARIVGMEVQREV